MLQLASHSSEAGFVGGEVLSALLARQEIERVTCLSRRAIGVEHCKLTRVLHEDFTRYDDALTAMLAEHDACIWTLGGKARLEMQGVIDRYLNDTEFGTAQAREICRIGLCNYFAGALILPYRHFLDAAASLRHDLELLAAHFQASVEQVGHRLSTLQRPELKGIPFFFARIDRAGNIIKRHSATRFQFARFGTACPLWN